MSQTDNKVSVVVPIYNVEKYLNRCLQSIINQSYKNIEIILVNDGSTDNSLQIAEEEEKNDSRIKIITQKNQGLSMARNTGIQHATGEYICFVDSDDFVHKDYVKCLIENLEENDSDISVCDYLYINEKDETWSKKNKEEKIFSNLEAINDLLVGNQETEVMAWNKLYKLSLFKENNIFFPKGKLHEDNFTTYKLYYYAKKISLIPDKLYFYLQRTDSIMGKKFNIKRLDVLQAVEETKSFFKKENINLEPEIECYELNTRIGLLNNMIRDKFYGEAREQLIKEIKTKKSKYLKNKYVTVKIKLFLFLLIGKGRLYAFLLSSLDKIRKG